MMNWQGRGKDIWKFVVAKTNLGVMSVIQLINGQSKKLQLFADILDLLGNSFLKDLLMLYNYISWRI